MVKPLLYLVLALVLWNALLYWHQRSMVFFPYKQLAQSPADWGIDYEDVSLKTEDEVTLHGWFMPVRRAQLTVLFFHGNAGNISHRGASVEIFHRLGVNVFIIDYRGYGKSDGSISEEGFYKDARAAWQYLVSERHIDPEKIVIFGRSLGGTVAAKLASETQPGGLILESGFSSAKAVARSVFPFISLFTVMRYKLDTASFVAKARCPVLVVHSVDDEIIPIELGERLFQAANEPKTFIRIKGDHNNGFILSQPGYEQALAQFFSTLAKP